MPLPGRFNAPSSSSAVNRKSILSATPQQKISSNFNTLSCNSKFANLNSERKHLPDVRPLADQQYLQSCISTILNFCSKNNYSIRKETLNFMSTSEMEKLFTFILSFYEIKIKQNCLDLEIPKVMESLGYPYYINKTSLKSYATPKSKGVVLSMLVYLIEPLNIERKSIFDGKVDDFNLECLKLVLNRNQEEKNAFINVKKHKQMKIKNELEVLLKKNEDLKNELNLINSTIQDDKLNKMKKDILIMQEQLEGFKSYEQQMKNYVELSLKDNEEIKKKIELVEEDIKRHIGYRIELEQKIKEQPYSVDEIKYFIQRDKQVQIEIQKMNEELKKATSEYFQDKLKQDEIFDSLKELFFKLTTMIRSFKDDITEAENLNECLSNEKYQELNKFLYNPELDENTDYNLELYSSFLKLIKQNLDKDLLSCKEKICKSHIELENSLNSIKNIQENIEMLTKEKLNLIQDLELKKLDTMKKLELTLLENEELKKKISAIDQDVKTKRNLTLEENIKITKLCEETIRDLNDFWLSVKNEVENIQKELFLIKSLPKALLEEKEKTKCLNQELHSILNTEKACVENKITQFGEV